MSFIFPKRLKARAARTVVRRRSLLAAMLVAASLASGADAAPRARNVILFLGDAGGLSTIHAAGVMAHNKPQSLFIHSMRNVALVDTSALDGWVSDSAAGMTAIMTGRKTNNGMLSVVPSGKDDTVPVKTLLEYAEQRGLSTGIITNKPYLDATPAATYAHVSSRRDVDEVLRQLLAPRFGDGVDILIGKGRAFTDKGLAQRKTTAEAVFTAAGYRFGEDPLLVRQARRVAVLRDADFAPLPAVEATLAQLARNKKGYFLMVEWDMHADRMPADLRQVVEMDDMIRRISASAGKDTLILFAADHSFGLRMSSGSRATPLEQQYAAEAAKPGVTERNNALISVDHEHSGEEVIAAASGPGAEKVRGFMPNTRLFQIMMAALGWEEDK